MSPRRLEIWVGDGLPRGTKPVFSSTCTNNGSQVRWEPYLFSRGRLNDDSLLQIRSDDPTVILILSDRTMDVVLVSDTDDYSPADEILRCFAAKHGPTWKTYPVQKHTNLVTKQPTTHSKIDHTIAG